MRPRECIQCRRGAIHFKGGFCSSGCKMKYEEQRARALNYADFDDRDGIPEPPKVPKAPGFKRLALIAEARHLLLQGA